MTAVVARLTTDVAVHELVREGVQHRIETTLDDGAVSEVDVTQEQAAEWCGTVRQCGGVVFEREVSRCG